MGYVIKLLVFILVLNNIYCAFAATTPEPESANKPPGGEPEPQGEAEPEAETEPEGEGEGEDEPLGERFEETVIIKWISLFTFCIVTIIVGNVIIIVILLRSKATRGKQANVFFLSLLIARTSVAILVIPARITGLFSNELLGSVLCKMCHFSGRGSAVTSVLSTTAVAIAKYYELRQPPSTPPVPLRTTIIQLVFIWLAGYAWAIRALFLNDLFLANTTAGPLWVCSTPPSNAYVSSIFIFVDFTLLFCIPFTIVLVCYAKVIKILNQRSLAAQASINSCKLAEQREKNELLMHKQGIRMLIVVMILFTICYSLPYIFKLYIYFRQVNMLMSNFAEVEMWIYWVSYTNPWLNIFAYVIFRDDIQKGFANMCGRKGRNNSVVDSTPGSDTTSEIISESSVDAEKEKKTWPQSQEGHEAADAPTATESLDTPVAAEPTDTLEAPEEIPEAQTKDII